MSGGGAPDSAPTEVAQPPETIGPYRVLSQLGKGGMGVVYVAQDPALDRKVVVKVLHNYLANDPVFIQRFVLEANNAASVNHPSVIRIFQVETAGPTPYIVMEYFEGEPLTQRIQKQGAVGNALGLTIARNVALGLREAARRGLIHRDVKPSNILVDAEGFVKIVDFGIAKSIERDLKLTQTGELIGTPYFMAPETLKGGKCDFRSDMYALGVTLYCAFTGKYPYDVHSVAELAVQLETQKLPPDPVEIRPDLPPATAELIRRLMSSKPENRYADYDELVAAIERVISPTGRTLVARRRTATPWYAAAAVLAAGVVAAVWYVGREKAPPIPAVSSASAPRSQSTAAPPPQSSSQLVPPAAGVRPAPSHAAPTPEAPAAPAGELSSPSPPLVPAPPPPAPGVELVYDFVNRSAADGWLATAYGLKLQQHREPVQPWAWDQGRLVSHLGSQMVLRKILTGDASVSVVLEFTGLPTGAFVLGLYAAPGAERGYYVRVGRDGVKVGKYNFGAHTLLLERTDERPVGKFTIGCVVDGSVIHVLVDQRMIGEFKDSSFRDGLFAMRAPDGTVAVYSVAVRAQEIRDLGTKPGAFSRGPGDTGVLPRPPRRDRDR